MVTVLAKYAQALHHLITSALQVSKAGKDLGIRIRTIDSNGVQWIVKGILRLQRFGQQVRIQVCGVIGSLIHGRRLIVSPLFHSLISHRAPRTRHWKWDGPCRTRPTVEGPAIAPRQCGRGGPIVQQPGEGRPA